MRARNHRFLGVALWAAILAVPTTVSAQSWLQDRAQRQGAGIRAGNIEVHPGVGLEGGFQSNVFYAADATDSSGILRLTPHIHASTLTRQRRDDDVQSAPPKLQFRGGGSVGLYHYFSVERDDVPLEFSADADLLLLPERPFSIGINATASRSIRWTNPLLDDMGNQATSQSDFGRNTIIPGGRIILQTRGGILKTELSGSYNLTFYDEGDGLEQNDSNEVRGRALTTWKLFPKTALFHDLSLRYRTFGDPNSPVASRNDGWMLTNMIGVNGAITQTIGTTLAVGYGAGFYEEDPNADDFDDLLAQVLLRWSPSERSRFTVGYTRAYEHAFQGNYLRNDRFKLRIVSQFGGAFLLGVRGGFGLVTYGSDRYAQAQGSNSADRDDTRIDAGLDGEYRFADGFAVTAMVGYEQLASDFTNPNGAGVEWKNAEGWLGLRAFW